MSRPEIQNSVQTGAYRTNYLEQGSGDPLIFIHGSGPGVSAYANWRLVLPKVAEVAHCYAPDMLGFGYSDKPADIRYNMALWTDQLVAFMDALKIEKADLVGNSFGGGLAIAMAVKHPDRVRKMVLMGAMGVDFPITHGLDSVWGYQPSPENMLNMLNLFCYDKKYANKELAQVRYQASIEPGFQEAFGIMFPAPRQNSVKDMASPEDKIRQIPHETLIVHGREDQVIPVDNAYRLINLIDKAELHVFGQCGHWTQIERADDFATLVKSFITRK